MKLRTIMMAAVLVAATALVTKRVVSQDEGAGDGYEVQMMQWMKYAQPGELHKHLEQFVGSWEQKVEWWVAPGAEPTVSSSEVEYKRILDGRFIVGDYKGTMNGAPYKGMDVLGYDNYRGEFVGLWIDNMSTAFMLSRGGYDAKSRTFTMRGTMDDVLAGKRDKPFRTLTRLTGEGESVYQMYVAGADGEEYMALQVTARRR